jgi:hypothetical protein
MCHTRKIWKSFNVPIVRRGFSPMLVTGEQEDVGS